MYSVIKNENYGYAVATYGDYVAASNPDFFRWDFATASVRHTGSVDYFRYNKATDLHDYIGTWQLKRTTLFLLVPDII